MKTTTKASEFMTRQEVADRLRVSLRTVDRIIDDGELRTKKSRQRRLIYRVSVDAYIETLSD